MRGSPVRNFLCVIALLAAMAAAASLATRRPDETVEAARPNSVENRSEGNPGTVEVDIHMRFSHPPRQVSLIPAAGGPAVIEAKPSGNDIGKTLTLPADRASEFLLDIEWPERERAVYFAMITQRREGLEDVDVILTSDDPVLSTVLTVNPLNKAP